jgi:hypothetical protein
VSWVPLLALDLEDERQISHTIQLDIFDIRPFWCTLFDQSRIDACIPDHHIVDLTGTPLDILHFDWQCVPATDCTAESFPRLGGL